MTAQDRFIAYALDFEKTFQDDDWSRLEPYFAEDAVYAVEGGPFSCVLEGREAILKGLRRSIDGFDRRCAVRTVQPKGGPVTETRDGHEVVTLRWKAHYELGDAPPLEFDGTSTTTYEGDRIVRLEDRYTAEEAAQVAGWLAAHAPGLDMRYTD